jgi:NAD(P)-dependent dehydrogenase (short-subunit alcohol dehydrogenase family)
MFRMALPPNSSLAAGARMMESVQLPRSPSFSLAGRRALVTGASKGIGLAIATAFGRAGADVVLCARTEADLGNVVTALENEGCRASALVADVSDIEGFSAAVSSQDPFDIFCNNAGTNRPKPMLDVTVEDFDAVMGLNLRAAYFAAQAVVRAMVAAGRGGSIINISSQMGHVGAANRTLYCASKWALEGLTKALCVELGPHDIRVNTLCPTFIETPMTKPFFEDDAFRQSVLSKIKLGRLGQVSDVMGAALFLASDASALMTGSSLLVDGGWTAD